MSGEAGPAHPGGTTLYHCPLCRWTHAALPSTIASQGDLHAGRCLMPDAVAGLLAAEGVIAAHITSHPLAEWVREVVRLQELLAAYRKVYDNGDPMDETIRHLAACGTCDPVGYDHTLCDGYSAAVSADAERIRTAVGQ